MKPSPLAAGLRAAAGKVAATQSTLDPRQPTLSAASPGHMSAPVKRKRRRPSTGETVLIGGHFAPEVRRTLLLLQAESVNAGKSLKVLLGEAINDLCVKYGKPEPYCAEE